MTLSNYKLQDNIPQFNKVCYSDQVNTNRLLNKKLEKVKTSDGTWENQKKGKRKIMEDDIPSKKQKVANISKKLDNKKFKRKHIDEDEGSSEKVEILAKKSLKKKTIKEGITLSKKRLKKKTIKEGESLAKKSLKKKTIKDGEIPAKKKTVKEGESPAKKSLKKKTIKDGEILAMKSLKKKTIKEGEIPAKKKKIIKEGKSPTKKSVKKKTIEGGEILAKKTIKEGESPAKMSLKEKTNKEGEIPANKKKKTIKEGESPVKKKTFEGGAILARKSLKKKTMKEGKSLAKKSLKKKSIMKVNDIPKKSETLKIKDERTLQLETKGFCWNDNVRNGDICNGESSSDEEEEEKLKEKTKKLSKAERLQKAAEEEDRLHQSELVRVQKDRVPESVMDYEELLQASPNSSAIWIQFISYHLQNAEIEKAKAVAVRALQRIPHTEEHERVNVWTVMLRLEVMYGDKESLKASFNEALSTNEQKKIYNAMVLIYGEANKIQEAEELFRKMCKKFSQDPTVWTNAILFMFKFNNGQKAKQILDKSLLSLPKPSHVAVIHRYAQFEFQYGDPEKGKTVYESLVGNYPKRIDIWGVYVDMLTKHKEISAARRVLERMISLKLRLPKMRSIFKRLLQFEQLHGNEDSVDEVKNRVLEYVNAALGE